jgi:hypothetical protein
MSQTVKAKCQFCGKNIRNGIDKTYSVICHHGAFNVETRITVTDAHDSPGPYPANLHHKCFVAIMKKALESF